jgi:ribosomal protein L11 methylase PrmA
MFFFGILPIIIQLVFAGFILYLLVAFVTGGPFVPSAYQRAKRMVVMAKITKGQTVIDLGSGDGRILLLAAQAGARARGVEINPYLVWYTRLRAKLAGVGKEIQVTTGNLWTFPLKGADVVFVYLLPWRMKELAAKLSRELAPGTRVISNSFIFPQWKIIDQDRENHIYVFKTR